MDPKVTPIFIKVMEFCLSKEFLYILKPEKNSYILYGNQELCLLKNYKNIKDLKFSIQEVGHWEKNNMKDNMIKEKAVFI